MKHIVGLITAAALAAVSFCAYAGDLPNGKLTPGKINPALTQKVLCAKGFTTKSVRSVPDEIRLKSNVYAEYHLTDHKGACGLVKRGCEVDHLISLEIGGLTDIKNLWPQPYGTKPWNAAVKDRLENRLHTLVCKKTITLGQAQKKIAKDWIAAYKKYCANPKDCPAWSPPK